MLGGLLDRPAYRSSAARPVPAAGRTPVTDIWPVVTVPVLSKTTAPMAREDSRAW